MCVSLLGAQGGSYGFCWEQKLLGGWVTRNTGLLRNDGLVFQGSACQVSENVPYLLTKETLCRSGVFPTPHHPASSHPKPIGNSKGSSRSDVGKMGTAWKQSPRVSCSSDHLAGCLHGYSQILPGWEDVLSICHSLGGIFDP